MLSSNILQHLDRIYDSPNYTATPCTETEYQDLISVIIPSYNNEKYLRRSINSVISQRSVNFELIVVDDGSTDGSVALARSIADRYENIRVISLLRNFGCYYARNVGLLHAKGSYITFHDSDDIAHPEMLIKQLRKIKATPQAVASLCLRARWDKNFTNIIQEAGFGENTLFFKKNIIHKIGYYDSVRYGGDTEFRSRIESILGASTIAHLSQKLYAVRTVEDSLTTTSGESNMIRFEESNTVIELSEPRKLYRKAQKKWHASGLKNRSAIKINFPLFERKFTLGANEQNASPYLGQKRIAIIQLTMNDKEYSWDKLEYLYKNFDIIFLLTHDNSTKKLVQNLRVQVISSLKEMSFSTIENSYIFILSDCINYSDKILFYLLHYIECFKRTCIVGVEGMRFDEYEVGAIDVQYGFFADSICSHTLAWHSSCFAMKDYTQIEDVIKDIKAKLLPIFITPQLFEIKKQNNIAEQYYFSASKRSSQGQDLSRIQVEKTLAYGFDKATLSAAGIFIPEGKEIPVENISGRTSIIFIEGEQTFFPVRHNIKKHFNIIISISSPIKQAASLLQALAYQTSNDFSYTVALLDTSNDHNTHENLASRSIFPYANIYRYDGDIPFYLENLVIESIYRQHEVVILLDLNDEEYPFSDPYFLSSLAERFSYSDPIVIFTQSKNIIAFQRMHYTSDIKAILLKNIVAQHEKKYCAILGEIFTMLHNKIAIIDK